MKETGFGVVVGIRPGRSSPCGLLGCISLLLLASCSGSDSHQADVQEVTLKEMLAGTFDNFEARRQQSEADQPLAPRGQYRLLKTEQGHWRLEFHVADSDRPADMPPALKLASALEFDLQAGAEGATVLLGRGDSAGCQLRFRRRARAAASEPVFAADLNQGHCLPTLLPDSPDADGPLHVEIEAEGLHICSGSADDCADRARWLSYRRALIFTGWAFMHPDGPQPLGRFPTSALTVGASGLRLHSEGGTWWFTDEQGNPTGYGIRIERPYYSPQIRVLKLGLVRLQDSDSTVVYTWTAADSKRIGINLRWLQSGLTLAEDSPQP